MKLQFSHENWESILQGAVFFSRNVIVAFQAAKKRGAATEAGKGLVDKTRKIEKYTS
jgi:hypothetical protein